MSTETKVPALSALTNGQVEIHVQANARRANDMDATGHIYFGSLHLPDEAEFVTLDDRLDLSLELQLVAELRRIRDVYDSLADTAEQRTAAA